MTEPETATPIKDSERAASSIEKGKEINIGSDSDSEDEESEAGKDEKTCSMDNLTRLKREKRLEMNRKSARERRKRKKMLIETLEQQVSELTKSNEKFRRDNQQLVLKVNDLSDRLAKQEKELLLLRSITGNASESQLMAHHFSSPSSLGATSSMLTSLPSLPQGIGYDTTEASSTGDSLRRMLHAQGLNRASTASAAMGSNQGLAFGVAPNRAIDQEILCRIGRDPSAQALYDRMMPSNDVRSGLGTALQHQNALRLPSAPSMGAAHQYTRPPLPGLLSANSESSRGVLSQHAALGPSNDPAAALLLEQLLQERRQQQQQNEVNRFFPR